MPTRFTDAEFLSIFREAGRSPSQTTLRTGLTERSVYARLASLRAKGHDVETQSYNPAYQKKTWAYDRIRRLDVSDGVVIIYSDAHYWPGDPPTPAFHALIRICRRLKPKVVIANGDLGDFPKISQHKPAGWAKLPSVTDELEEIKARQADIKLAAGDAITLRTVGNHDARFDAYLVNHAEQFAGTAGTRFSDHLPDWPESWIVRLNDVTIKHRWNGGVHASWNNALKGHGSIVTGHTHSLLARPLRGFNGRFWGIETGTLSREPNDTCDGGAGPFEYTEGNPTITWMSGFVVLTFRDSLLLPPEFCSYDHGSMWFRGEVVI